MLHRVVTGAVEAGAGETEAGPSGTLSGVTTGRVVLVHGFTQTGRSWEATIPNLARRRQVVAVDLPGHGGSAAVRLDFVETVAALGEAGGRGAYAGYSMGGRLCLRLALDRPDLVTALVLTGASPGLADPDDRADRRRDDDALAAGIEVDGTTAFVDRWLRQPLFAGLHPTPADLAARRANPAEGLAASLRALGTGAQDPLWQRLGDLAMPVLLLVGENDLKFAALAEEMASAIADHTVARIPGAGHAAHLERPAEWTAVVTAFLDTHHAS
ncbi:MAG: alpha/beta fold hydrolase [Acidimicrobiales bacterium]